MVAVERIIGLDGKPANIMATLNVQGGIPRIVIDGTTDSLPSCLNCGSIGVELDRGFCNDCKYHEWNRCSVVR